MGSLVPGLQCKRILPGLVQEGATDDTIIARVGEGIVSAIGSSDNYSHVSKTLIIFLKQYLIKD